MVFSKVLLPPSIPTTKLFLTMFGMVLNMFDRDSYEPKLKTVKGCLNSPVAEKETENKDWFIRVPKEKPKTMIDSLDSTESSFFSSCNGPFFELRWSWRTLIKKTKEAVVRDGSKILTDTSDSVCCSLLGLSAWSLVNISYMQITNFFTCLLYTSPSPRD